MAAEPNTLQEAIVYFADPTNCREYLVARRWPKGVTCPRCIASSEWLLTCCHVRERTEGRIKPAAGNQFSTIYGGTGGAFESANQRAGQKPGLQPIMAGP